MERVNSWGREIKDKFSVSFKKDEEDIKLFLNEQPSPVEYLKVLVRKDMGIFNKSKLVEPFENNVEDKKDTDIELSDEAKQKLMQMLED